MMILDRPKIERALPKIKVWLTSRGAEVLEPMSEWEMLRFRSRDGIGIIYKRSKSNDLSFTGGAAEVMEAFFSNKYWSAGVSTTGKAKKGKYFAELLKRDGTKCFYCLLELGDDMTREHLVPVLCGGPHHIANLVLAHEQCNQRAGHMSVMEKVRIRDRALLGAAAPFKGKEIKDSLEEAETRAIKSALPALLRPTNERPCDPAHPLL